MPCCAFAAFIVGQIAVALGAFRRLLWPYRAMVPGRAIRNDAVAWRPGPTAMPARRRRHTVRALALVAAVEALLVVGAIYGARAHATHAAHAHHAGGTP